MEHALSLKLLQTPTPVAERHHDCANPQKSIIQFRLTAFSSSLCVASAMPKSTRLTCFNWWSLLVEEQAKPGKLTCSFKSPPRQRVGRKSRLVTVTSVTGQPRSYGRVAWKVCHKIRHAAKSPRNGVRPEFQAFCRRQLLLQSATTTLPILKRVLFNFDSLPSAHHCVSLLPAEVDSANML
jgi:hypothetical protein